MPQMQEDNLNLHFAKLNFLHFYPLEVVSCFRDPQLKISYICLIVDKTFANVGFQTLISLPLTVIWSVYNMD